MFSRLIVFASLGSSFSPSPSPSPIPTPSHTLPPLLLLCLLLHLPPFCHPLSHYCSCSHSHSISFTHPHPLSPAIPDGPNEEPQDPCCNAVESEIAQTVSITKKGHAARVPMAVAALKAKKTRARGIQPLTNDHNVMASTSTSSSKPCPKPVPHIPI